MTYTGPDTKMSQNSKINANKFSTVERTINLCFISYLMLLLAEVGLCLTLEYCYGLDLPDNDTTPWYLAKRTNLAANIINDAVSYLILFSYIIPISIYVTLEVQRVIGSMFIIWDRDLYDPATDQAAMVNSSDLNEELGQINLLFTDKTGTLTENVMVLKGASIAGRLYSVCDLLVRRRKGRCSATDQSGPNIKTEKKIHQFLMALCLCHSGQVRSSDRYYTVY